jgi:hypothetical protein
MLQRLVHGALRRAGKDVLDDGLQNMPARASDDLALGGWPAGNVLVHIVSFEYCDTFRLALGIWKMTRHPTKLLIRRGSIAINFIAA